MILTKDELCPFGRFANVEYLTIERFDENILYENAKSVLFEFLVMWSRLIPDCEPYGDPGFF